MRTPIGGLIYKQFYTAAKPSSTTSFTFFFYYFCSVRLVFHPIRPFWAIHWHLFTTAIRDRQLLSPFFLSFSLAL